MGNKSPNPKQQTACTLDANDNKGEIISKPIANATGDTAINSRWSVVCCPTYIFKSGVERNDEKEIQISQPNQDEMKHLMAKPNNTDYNQFNRSLKNAKYK